MLRQDIYYYFPVVKKSPQFRWGQKGKKTDRSPQVTSPDFIQLFLESGVSKWPTKVPSLLKHWSKGQQPKHWVRSKHIGKNEVFVGLTRFCRGSPSPNTHRYHPYLLAFDVEALFDLFMLRTGSGASRRPAVPLVTPPRRDSTTGQVGGNENLYGLGRVQKFLVSLNYTKLLIFFMIFWGKD